MIGTITPDVYDILAQTEDDDILEPAPIADEGDVVDETEEEDGVEKPKKKPVDGEEEEDEDEEALVDPDEIEDLGGAEDDY